MNAAKAIQHQEYAIRHARLMTPLPNKVCVETVPVIECRAPHMKAPITVKNIQTVVAEHFGMDRDEMITRSLESVILPRQIAMYLARKFTGKSLMRLARFFGMSNKTIRNSFDKIERLRHDDPELASDLAMIELRLGAA